MNLCQGCGTNMGDYPRVPATEVWHEYCGNCNKQYYEHQAEMERIEQEEKRRKRKETWDRLEAKYGKDEAAEIMADNYGP